MTNGPGHGGQARSYQRGYLGWHGLAWAGANIAYQPLLSFLLPLKIVALGGRPDPILLSAAVLLSGVTAALSNLSWGLVGDRVVTHGGGRRTLILFGLAGTLYSYVALALAMSPVSLLMALFFFQVMLNLMLSALAATAADEVPAHDKGLLGGVLCIGAPAGAGASVIATSPGISIENGLFWIGLMVPVMILPYALQRRYPLQRGSAQLASGTLSPNKRETFALLWSVRLVLQTASKAVFFFLVFYFAEAAKEIRPGTIASLTLIAALIAAPAALLLGHASDRHGRHREFLLISIAATASGLVLMAIQSCWVLAVVGYLVFACSAAICLSLHTGFAMLRLPANLASGKGLGLLNLTNTLPAVAVAVLGTAIVPQHGYSMLCWILAVAVMLAGGALLLRRN